MITDLISNLPRYKGINHNLDEVIDYIVETDFANLADGEHMISNNLFYIKQDWAGYVQSEAPFELHQEFCDIHISLDNVNHEKVGYLPGHLLETKKIFKELPENDTVFYDQHPKELIDLPIGHFVLFLPGEGHAPRVLSKNGSTKKILFKCKMTA